MRFVVILSLMLGVTSAQAFEIDLTKGEVERAKGRYLLEDLTVAVKGRVSYWDPCIRDGVLMIGEQTELLPDGDFVISRKPTGNFSLSFEPLDYNGKPIKMLSGDKRPVWFGSCELHVADYGFKLSTFTPVDDIDGFTKYSNWVDHVLKNFQLDD